MSIQLNQTTTLISLPAEIRQQIIAKLVERGGTTNIRSAMQTCKTLHDDVKALNLTLEQIRMLMNYALTDPIPQGKIRFYGVGGMGEFDGKTFICYVARILGGCQSTELLRFDPQYANMSLPTHFLFMDEWTPATQEERSCDESARKELGIELNKDKTFKNVGFKDHFFNGDQDFRSLEEMGFKPGNLYSSHLLSKPKP